MLIAHVNGIRQLAEKLAHKTHECRCPGCGASVLARVGDVRIPHWAHKRESSCPLAAGESLWHMEWKGLGRLEEIEVVRPEWPNNRADLCLVEGGLQQVVELQHSGITVDVIDRREKAYRDVVWIVDVRERAFSVQGDRYQWKRASQVWTCAEQVIFDDGTACHGRLAKAAIPPSCRLLFEDLDTTGSVITLPRPTTRVELLALLATFKAARQVYLDGLEAERIEREGRFKERQEAEAAEKRDSWFRASPAPPKTQWEQDQEDLQRVSASLEALRRSNAPPPALDQAMTDQVDHDALYGDWPAPSGRGRSR